MENKERRVKLEKRQQREIIMKAIKNFGSLKNLASKLEVPYPTFKNYFQEVNLLPERLFNEILKLSAIKRDRLNFSYMPYNWGRKIGGKRGMAAMRKKYPKEIIEWRKKAIINSHLNNAKKIQIPILNERLAEFIGIYLGDGTMTKYQIRISGDSRYDKFYFNYVSKIIFDLFSLKTTSLKQKNANTLLLIAYSKNLCDFLNKDFNLKAGDKIRNKNMIHKNILSNKKLSIACLRGLIDTDGSVSRRGRNGSQFCIQFTSHNKELLKQVYSIGKSLGIFTFVDKTGAGTNKWENIIKYFQIVGSSNPKHIIRFLLRKDGKNIYRDELSHYFEQEKYKNLNLPFTLKGV